MPNNNTDDLDFDTEDEELEDDANDGADDGADGGDEPKDDDSKGEDKRISDLQSRADKAEARANKAEKALKAVRDRGEGDANGSNDPERGALMTELREASLDAVFGEFAELKTYGIDRALIEGTTRAELRESAASLVGLIKSVATKERNRVLKENGITAEPSGAKRETAKDWDAMSDEEFDKAVEKAISGGDSIW